MYRPTVIKSIQRGTITIAAASLTNTATLSPTVDPANSLLHWLGESGTFSTSNRTDPGWAGLTFTSGTTITATRTDTNNPCTVSFEVIEYHPGILKSVQRGNKTLTGATTTVTITSVTTTKAMLEYLGHTGDTALFTVIRHTANMVLTNSTTITMAVADINSAIALYWQVAEFI